MRYAPTLTVEKISAFWSSIFGGASGFDAFSILHTYPVNLLGLGRGLDFLLPSFPVSRQEKKVGALEIRPTEHHPKDSK